MPRAQGMLREADEMVQRGGSGLVADAQALSELVAVQSNVLDAMAAVKGARQLLGLCLQVGYSRAPWSLRNESRGLTASPLKALPPSS